MSLFSWDLGWLSVVLFIGLAAAADVPFVFDNNSSSIVNYNSSQLENISNQTPEIARVPPINMSSNNETVKNISGINKNDTNYLLPPYYLMSEEGSVNGNGQEWFKYGNINYDKGNYNESIENYERAIEENPRFADAWYNKGTALCRLGMYEEAIKAFDKALEISPNYANARENRDAAYNAIKR